MPDSVQGGKLEGDFRGGNQGKERMSREDIDREHMTNHGHKGDEDLEGGSDSKKEDAQWENLGSTPAGSQGNSQGENSTR